MSKEEPQTIKEQPLVTVGRFRDPVEAQMARGMLESAGIECFLEGANANSLVPMAFRVRLKVLQVDEDTARVMLMEAEIADGD